MTRLIDSHDALAILKCIRPRATRCSLNALVSRGLIQPQETIHARRFKYDADQVKSAVLRLAHIDGIPEQQAVAALETVQ